MLHLDRLAWPVISRLDSERAHELALWALERGLVGRDLPETGPLLATRVLDLDFRHPVGLAAGFDKGARVFGRMKGMGFAFAEVGGVTPRGQVGNPRPRLFRMAEDDAAINRMGFNNPGKDVVAARLRAGRGTAGLPVGVNLASNTDTDDPARDFEILVETFAPLVDYLDVDVSCPNTKNGRLFQDPTRLRDLLVRLRAACARAGATPPMLVKVASDLSEAETLPLAEVAVEGGVQGMVVANTSAARPPGLRSPHAGERGGLSGRPIFAASTSLLKSVARHVQGRLVLIGVGGVFDGADAYAKIRAGASLVQLYTSLALHGPDVVPRVVGELAGLLRRDGFTSISQAVGADL
ncbi:quinone-dependent dihydroorotate dehydrogenase [Zavarzinia sp. CC-PAN008]|uniref:quinone-dependent dihydroorotate dehydrogenase n=1 Tax=Zavarzinia sp. CC-PAN008 TaxID=3243332 RepID=UPI003F744F48